MKKKVLIYVMVIAIVFLLVFAISLYVTISLQNSIKGHYEYGTQIKIGDYVGFNLDDDKIYFGTVMPGGLATREVIINSTVSGYLLIRISGPMSDMLYVIYNYEYINEGEELNIELYVRPSDTAKPGVYESKVHVYVLESRNQFAEGFLPGKNIRSYGSLEYAPPPPAYISINITYPEDDPRSNLTLS